MMEIVFYHGLYVKKSGDNMSGDLLFTDANEGVQFIDNTVFVNASSSGNMEVGAAGQVVFTTPLVDFGGTDQVQFSAGLVGAPAIAIGAGDVGFYANSSTNLRAVIAGVTKWSWGATTNDTFQTIQPSTTGFDIGQSGRRFRNIFLDTQLNNSVATGTAPFVVASTTLCTNLNADAVDGRHVGTSGSTIPLLSTSNSWSAQQSFNAGGSSICVAMINPIGGTAYNFMVDASNIFSIATGSAEFFRLQSTGTTFNESGADLDHRFEGDSMTHMLFLEGNAASENIALLAAALPNWQAMDRGIFLGDATTVPTGNPSAGGFLYSEAGALKWRGSSGTVTTLGAA